MSASQRRSALEPTTANFRPDPARKQRPDKPSGKHSPRWSNLRRQSVAPPEAVPLCAEDDPLCSSPLPCNNDSFTALLGKDSLLSTLLQSPVDSEFLSPSKGRQPAFVKKPVQAEKPAERMWGEAEKAKLEMQAERAKMQAEKAQLGMLAEQAKLDMQCEQAKLDMQKAQMEAEKAKLETERAWLEVEKEKARLASERAQMQADKALLEAERTRQETERWRLEAAREVEAAREAEATHLTEMAAVEAEQEVSEESEAATAEAVDPAELLHGEALLTAVRRLKAAAPHLGPVDLHSLLMDEGFAAEIIAVRKAVRKLTKYEKRTIGSWTPSLADPEAMFGLLATAGQIFAPRVCSMIGWVLGKRH